MAAETKESSSLLIDRITSLVEIERSLTAAIEDAMPWLSSSASSSSVQQQGNVRPLPESPEDVERVLQVARNLSSRTSAPAGWNPQAPVIGFTTPNPLPHQLRGGSLGALQLELAKQRRVQQQEEDRVKKEATKRKKEEEERSKQQQQQQQQTSAPQQQQRPAKNPRLIPQQQTRPKQHIIMADMNLSSDDSSSEEEKDD
mmetsp:Transcript_11442/g.16787  ORF Transcript_11442/g.16787 Transcript_11442/m.16787 type:complete len:200 (-) Transcript_11442:28-627(-)